MIYAVIDTNVIVSALLAQNRSVSAPFTVLKAVFQGIITPVLSDAILKEYSEVLKREKFGFDQKKIELLLEQLKNQSVFVHPPHTKKKLPDLKDVCFYETALVYEDIGGLLITGNMKHFPDCHFAVTPALIKEKILNK
jgi:putative PIN family toxin of toxin-antitoxin system